MSIETLLQFSCVLRLSPSVILLGKAIPYPDEGDTIRKIMLETAECTEEQQRSILEIIRLFTSRA